MKLVITLNQDKLRLEIHQKRRVIDPHTKRGSAPGARDFNNPRSGVGVDFETALYYHDLSEKLITSLDKLLKRNNIDTTALNSFKIRGNTGKNSTPYKIVAVFIEGLRAGV